MFLANSKVRQVSSVLLYNTPSNDFASSHELHYLLVLTVAIFSKQPHKPPRAA